LYTEGYSTTIQIINYVLGIHIVTPAHDYSNVMCDIFQPEELGFLAINDDGPKASFFLDNHDRGSQSFPSFFTSFLDLLYITEDGLHVVVDNTRDIFSRLYVGHSDWHTDL
jgi:hypothetical protein